MFTGIVTNLAIIESLGRNKAQDLLLKISSDKNKISRQLEIGCSIACNGICLTLIEKKISGKKIILSFQASSETCAKTTLDDWQVGQEINLEFALRLGDELGGHMVLGHVDATAKITAIKPIKNSRKYIFTAPKNLMKFISEKGSVTLDGVSLTVNEVTKNQFSVNVIEHTFVNTGFRNCRVGDLVNLEIDAVARYVAKLVK